MSGRGIVDSSTICVCGTFSHSGVSVFSFPVLLLHDVSKHIAANNNMIVRFIAIKASIQIRGKDIEKWRNGKMNRLRRGSYPLSRIMKFAFMGWGSIFFRKNFLL